MTLIEYPDLDQGSDEWLEARRGIITASTVGQLIAPKTVKPSASETSRALIHSLLGERITGHIEPVFVSDDMMRGQIEEPFARDVYAERYGVEVREIGFMVEDRPGFRLGYSPDGLVGDDGLIEVKSRRPKKHLATIFAGQPPAENVAQMQAGLLVSGRSWCDYISYCGGMKPWVVRVTPDERWFEAITEVVTAFEKSAGELIDYYNAATDGMPVADRYDMNEGIVI